MGRFFLYNWQYFGLFCELVFLAPGFGLGSANSFFQANPTFPTSELVPCLKMPSWVPHSVAGSLRLSFCVLVEEASSQRFTSGSTEGKECLPAGHMRKKFCFFHCIFILTRRVVASDQNLPFCPYGYLTPPQVPASASPKKVSPQKIPENVVCLIRFGRAKFLIVAGGGMRTTPT